MFVEVSSSNFGRCLRVVACQRTTRSSPMAQPASITISPQNAARAQQRTGLVLLAMCLGVFIAQLDSSVVYLAVSNIGRELNAGITEQQWILDIYNVVYAALLLTGGTLADIFG